MQFQQQKKPQTTQVGFILSFQISVAQLKVLFNFSKPYFH